MFAGMMVKIMMIWCYINDMDFTIDILMIDILITIV